MKQNCVDKSTEAHQIDNFFYGRVNPPYSLIKPTLQQVLDQSSSLFRQKIFLKIEVAFKHCIFVECWNDDKHNWLIWEGYTCYRKVFMCLSLLLSQTMHVHIAF